jgi:hypothetical protein
MRTSAQRTVISIIRIVFLFSGVPARGESDESKLFDGLLNESLPQLNRMAASGDGRIYYTFSYVMEATLAQYEGTRDRKYLEQVLRWANL